MISVVSFWHLLATAIFETHNLNPGYLITPFYVVVKYKFESFKITRARQVAKTCSKKATDFKTSELALQKC